MLVKTRAIVFSSLKFGEADLITTCYTETDGIKSYMLKNILKNKRSAIKPSFFQPLSQLVLVANHKNKGHLEYLKEAKIDTFYHTLHTNVLKSGIAVFLSEILKNTIKEEQPNPHLYQFLKQSFDYLDNTDKFSNFHIGFLLKLSAYLGFSPDSTFKIYPWFNLMNGTFEQTKSDIYSVDGPAVMLLKKFLDASYETTAEVGLTRNERQELLNLIIAYYQLHIQDFKKPKSLSVLHQIFK